MPVLARLLLLACLASPACQQTSPDPNTEIPVRVRMVAVDDSNAPLMVLEEQNGKRWLPIWIGSSEAHSIASGIDERETPRPNSHDLANQMILRLGGELVRVVVTELRGGTYYAVMTLQTGRGTVEIDARPSDAIAIALRAGAPIFVREAVFQQSGERPDDVSDEQRIRGVPLDDESDDERPTGTSPATRHHTL